MGSSLYFSMTLFIWAALGGKSTATFMPGRDTRKKRSPDAYIQFERPEIEIVVYGETGAVDIKFGENKFLKNIQPRLTVFGKTYTISSKNKKTKLAVKNVEESTPRTTELGKILETTIEWTLGDSEKIVIGKIMQGVIDPFIHFKLILPWEQDSGAQGFNTPKIEYPWFVNDSANEHVLCWANKKFAPPRKDFNFAAAPVVMYDDELNAFMISTLDHFFVTGIKKHKQQGAMSCGLAGTVEKTPAGFSLESIICFGKGINKIIEDWGVLFRRRHAATGGGKIRDPYSNPITASVGYNTDNGAFYYYNTEKGKNYEDTMIAVREQHKKVGLPYGYYELDSWWYPKSYEKLPALLKIFVSGSALHWGEPPKPDVFPHGLKYMWEKLDRLPLMCHSRWFSPRSDYVKKYEFHVQKPGLKSFNLPLFAAPKHEDFWDDLFKDAKDWGLRCYLQDWLSYQYDSIDVMKTTVDFADAWTRNMARGAEKQGMTVQYCMAPSSFMMQAVKLPNVMQARASDDHNGMQPRRWYLPHFTQTSMLCNAIGFWPHKDTFYSSDKKVYWFYRERRPEMECLSAALSGGPVAPSDKLGNENKELIMRTCRSDGLLLKPDKPATPIDYMFKVHAKYYITSTYSKKPSGLAWYYVHVMNLWPKKVHDKGISQKDIGIKGKHVAYLLGKIVFVNLPTETTRIELELENEGQELVVLCPEIMTGVYLVGNSTKFITCSAKQFPSIDVADDGKSASIHVEGVPGEEVPVLLRFDEKAPFVIDQAIHAQIDDREHTMNMTAVMDAEGKRDIVLKV